MTSPPKRSDTAPRSLWSTSADEDPSADDGDRDDSEEEVWYVSLGSMMNQYGLRSRGVEPAESVPCVIHGRRRVFSCVSRPQPH